VVAKIEEILENGEAIANIDNVKKTINLGIMASEIAVGDYVLIHTGFAIAKVDEEKANQILEAYKGKVV
jgi:hydrogenase expression/formation protein HypC